MSREQMEQEVKAAENILVSGSHELEPQVDVEAPSDVEIEIDAEIADGEPDLPGVEVVGVPIHADPNRVVVDGEEITPETPLQQMRPAAKFLKLPFQVVPRCEFGPSW